MVGHGGSSAGSYLAAPTSPISSHCASVVATSTVRVKSSSWAILVPCLSLLWTKNCSWCQKAKQLWRAQTIDPVLSPSAPLFGDYYYVITASPTCRHSVVMINIATVTMHAVYALICTCVVCVRILPLDPVCRTSVWTPWNLVAI